MSGGDDFFGDPFASGSGGGKGTDMFGDDLFSEGASKPTPASAKKADPPAAKPAAADDDVFGSSSKGGDDLFGGSGDDGFPAAKPTPAASTPKPAAATADDMFGSSNDDDLGTAEIPSRPEGPAPRNPVGSRGAPSAEDDLFGAEPTTTEPAARDSASAAYQAAAEGDEAVATEKEPERKDSVENKEEEEEEEPVAAVIHTSEPTGGKGPREEKNGFHSYIFPNGDQYEGDWVNDKVHGKGTMKYEKEGKFTGEFSQGKKVRGEFVYNKDVAAPKGGCTYVGEFKADKWNGQGKLILADGGVYEGEFAAGQYEGKGTLKYAEGKDPDVYDGQYKKGKPNGQGKMLYKQGKFLEYEGKWEDGTFLEGVLKYRDGGSFTGPFKKNKRHGKGVMEYGEVNEEKLKTFDGIWHEDAPSKGIMEWQNGDKFDGEFDHSKPILEPKKGVMNYANGDVYTGTYVDGNRSGAKGTFKFADGRILQGEFKKDDCVSGEMKYPDESKYKGEFAVDVLGVRQGQGVCVYPNKDIVAGMWVNDKIDSGEKKFSDGGSYKGVFDQEGRFTGSGCLRVWPDGHKFEGEFKEGLMIRGKLTVQEEGVYEGEFDGNEKKHGQGKQTTHHYLFEGTFADGLPVEGDMTYTQSEFKSYHGPVNPSFKPEGKGHLTWANQDTYEGHLVNGQLQGHGALTKNSTQETFEGDFEEGTLRKGEAKYGDEKNEILSYTGDFNSNWQRDGQGTIHWRAGHTFVGQSKDNQLVEGEYKNVNGTSFKGTFNVDGHLYGEGVFTFPSGPEYGFSKAKEGSFPHRIAAMFTELEVESKGLDTLTVSELSLYGVWPQIPELSTEDRLPAVASEGLRAIQAKGGQLSLNELQDKRSKSLHTLNTLHASAASALETEAKTDELARTRFEGRWDIPPSDSFTGEYKEKLATTMSLITKAEQDNEALLNERTAAAGLMDLLVPTVETLEAQIRQQEADDPARAALVASLASQVTVIDERKTLLDSFQQALEALDGGLALIECVDGNKAEEALGGAMNACLPLQEQIKANMGEHHRLFAAIQAQYATYSTNLPKVKETALNSVLVELEKAIGAFNQLHSQSTLLCQRLQEQLDNEQEPLAAQVTKFVADRAKERKTLANKLMIEELHAAVKAGDQEKIRELCDDKSQTIDVNEKGAENVTALQLAVVGGEPGVIQLLASKGGQVKNRDSNNHSLLWLAIEEQKLNCIQTLIECGAEVDRAEDEKSGETLLHIMAKSGKLDILELLLRAKASPTTSDNDGRTALLHGCAANGGNFDVVKLLIEWGASPNSQDNLGEGPLHLTNNTTIQSFLVEHGTRLELVNKKKAKAGDPKALKNALEKWKKADNIIMREAEVKEGDPKWTGNEGTQCQWCVEKFGLFTRRHHCRRCGALNCDNCSKKKAVNGKNKIRICDGCFNNLTFLAASGL